MGPNLSTMFWSDRGLRPGPGKRLLIIDHGANVYRHGFVEDIREWSLEKSKPQDMIEKEQSERIKKYAACPDCGAIITGKVCHTCGQEGIGLKSHDLLGNYLCYKCHGFYDGEFGTASQAERRAWFREQYPKTMVRLCEKLARGELKL